MISGFAVVVAVASLFVAAWSFLLAARNREPKRALLIALAVVEALVAAQLVIGVVLLIGGGHPGNLATFLAYLISALVIIPAGAAWALAERSRSSTMILGVACIAISVMVLRLFEIWRGARA